MKAAVYLRVSTDRQDEANQEPDCLRLCHARGWDPVIFRETESGAKKRPIWEQVKRAAHRGEVGAVVIWALDRAGRDRLSVAADLAELAHKRAAVVSVRESWLDQPVGPMRDLLIQILAWFGESERARLIERTRAGLARARAEGKHLGRKWTDPALVERMREIWSSGRGPGFAARTLGVPRSTVRTWFGRFAADGVTSGNGALPGVTLRMATKGVGNQRPETAENQGE